jgi:uncharacterized membrane protein
MGPVQLLVVGFEDGNFEGKILAELRRLREQDIIRIVDLLVVAKDEQGDVARIEHSDLTPEEAMEFGTLAGALLGLGADGEASAIAGAAAAEDASILGDEDVWYLADAIPPGATAAIALIEHRWAVPLRDAIGEAGGQAFADTWVHPRDLAAIGAAV